MNKNLKPALLVGTSLAIAISAVLGAMSTEPAQNDARQEAAPPTFASQAPPAASAPAAIPDPAPASAPASAAPPKEKEQVAVEAPASAPEQAVEKAVEPAPEKRLPAPPAKTRPAIAQTTPRQEQRREHPSPEPLDRREVDLAKATNPIYTTNIDGAKRKLNFVRASTDSVTIMVSGRPREYKVGQSMGNGEKVLDVHHDVEGGIIITTSRQTLVLNP